MNIAYVELAIFFLLQALGAGTVEDFENELIEAPEEEEEFDVLNDETFGECTTGTCSFVRIYILVHCI